LERLATFGVDGCPWQGYLPAGVRDDLARRRQWAQALIRIPAPGSAVHLPNLLSCRVSLDGPVQGQVWKLARDPVGCRAVQRAIEEASSDAHREAISQELHGHVWEGLQCPHANHVLQKCVVALRPEASQFIVDELCARGTASQAACHKYGCRIVQRLVEFLPWSQTDRLVECLLQEVGAVARHAYGNYVVQNLLEHGTPEHRDHILKTILSNVRAYAADPYGTAVVASVLQHCNVQEKKALAEAIVAEDGLLLSLACTRLGHGCVPKVLEHLPHVKEQQALVQLWSQTQVLLASRFGRQVLQSLPPAPSAETAVVGGEDTRGEFSLALRKGA